MLRPFCPTLCISLALVLLLPATGLAARQRSASITLESVNDAGWQAQGKPSIPLLVKLQVLLDRAHASPGEIDGTQGENTRKAIAAYAEMKGLEPTDEVTEDLWRAIAESDTEPTLVTYTRKTLAVPSRKEFPRISSPRPKWTGSAIRARGSFSPRNST
jgi:peptidoglycan hydrolase-like protein with peptidoglycan-binding domain